MNTNTNNICRQLYLTMCVPTETGQHGPFFLITLNQDWAENETKQ